MTVLRVSDTSRGGATAVSSRRLAASLWRLAATTDGGGSVTWRCGLFDRLGFEICSSSLPIHKFETEGLTKWDHCNTKAWNDVGYFRTNRKSTDLFKARKRVIESELTKESASWMRTEQNKMCSIFKNLENGVKRERKSRKKTDIVNSKMVRDIAEAKLLTRKFMHNLGKEKKAREWLGNVCNELAKEVEGYKAEIRELRSQQEKIQEEVEEERKMMQLAEVWREEQAQMKLVDAKVILEDKFDEMNNLIAELKAFLGKSNSKTDVSLISKDEFLRESFDPVNIKVVKEFSPKSENMFIIKEENVCHNKSMCSSGLTDGGSGFEGTRGVVDTEIYASQIRSESYNMSKCDNEQSKIAHHEYKKSECSEISLVSSNQSKKKGSSANKLQKTLPRNKDSSKKIVFDGSTSFVNRSKSSIRKNPHVVRAMKGHIEWPRGVQRHGSTNNLLEAKLESQKTILRNVLKQRS